MSVLDTLLVKVDRAYKHIIDLNAETLRFLAEGGPYETFFKDDPKTLQRTYYLRVLKETPIQLSALIGDIAQNLRSALDHLAWHLVQASPVFPKAEGRDIYFPLYETATKYNDKKMGKIRGMADAAISAIDDIEPYYRITEDPASRIGNGAPLYLLDRINNLDKHRLLIPIWGSMVSHTIPRSKRAELSEEFLAAYADGELFLAAGPLTPGPLKDGSKLCTLPISDVDNDMKFNFRLTFGEPALIRGKEVHTTLAAVHKRVRDIMISFDKKGLL